jgi:hypothetical protein
MDSDGASGVSNASAQGNPGRSRQGMAIPVEAARVLMQVLTLICERLLARSQ